MLKVIWRFDLTLFEKSGFALSPYFLFSLWFLIFWFSKYALLDLWRIATRVFFFLLWANLACVKNILKAATHRSLELTSLSSFEKQFWIFPPQIFIGPVSNDFRRKWFKLRSLNCPNQFVNIRKPSFISAYVMKTSCAVVKNRSIVHKNVRGGSEALALKSLITTISVQIFYKKFLAVPQFHLSDVLIKIY